jgi:hypothetical protein
MKQIKEFLNWLFGIYPPAPTASPEKQNPLIKPKVKYKIETHTKKINIGRVELVYHMKNGEKYRKEVVGHVYELITYTDLITGRRYYDHELWEFAKDKEYQDYLKRNPYIYRNDFLMSTEQALHDLNYTIEPKISITEYNQNKFHKKQIKLNQNEVEKVEAIEFHHYVEVEESQLVELK